MPEILRQRRGKSLRLSGGESDGERVCMERKPCNPERLRVLFHSFRRIQPVMHDGMIHRLCMDTKLMRTASPWQKPQIAIVRHGGDAFPRRLCFPQCPTRASLRRAQTEVLRASADCPCDDTLRLFYLSIHKRAVLLFREPVVKLFFEMDKRFLRFREYEHAGGFLVEAVHYAGTVNDDAVCKHHRLPHPACSRHSGHMPISHRLPRAILALSTHWVF